MTIRAFQIALAIVLLCAGTSLAASELSLVGTSNAVAQDFSGSGIFTQFGPPASGFGLTIRRFDFEVPSGIPRDQRSLVTFDIRSLGDSRIVKSYLDFRTTSFTSSSQELGILAFQSNGVLSVADVTRSARQVASYDVADLGIGPHTVELDTAELTHLLSPTLEYIGLRLQGLASPVNTQLARIDDGFDSPPTLRLLVVPEPAASALCAVLAICGGGVRRRRP